MWRSGFARTRAWPAEGPEGLAVLSRYRNTADEIGVGDICMALCHIDVAVARIGDDVCRLGESFGRIALHARLAERHQQLAVGAEFESRTALLRRTRIFLDLIRSRDTRVGNPDIAVLVDMNAVRPDEQSGAKAFDLLAVLVEMVNRVDVRAEAARHRSGRAAVGRPNRFAVLVDGDPVGAAPGALLRGYLRPIADDLVGIGAAVHRRNIPILR